MKRFSLIAGLGLTCLLSGGMAAAQQEFISIGTGGVTGVYYPTGGAICRQVNKGREEHGIRCSAEATGGSIYNIETVRTGELAFGVAQSDAQYYAYHGNSKFAEKGAFEKLRAVFSVHPEPYTVLVRADSDVKQFTDFKGKRVNVGNPGSGQRGTTEVLMSAMGMTMDDLALAAELNESEMSQALCDDRIDVMTYVVGHPAAAITEAANTCDVKLVPMKGPVIEKLVAGNEYYRFATIPGGMYKGTDEDVQTFGVGATLITSADVSEEVVYTVVKAVFDHFDDFRKLHPAFANLTEQEMISEGLSAPLHEGAKKYYKERGWM